MDLKQLNYYVHVAESGSFTRAANSLNVSQPVLSRQIRLLELEFGQPLLKRTGRGVVTTDAGDLLLDHARGLLGQAERVREDMLEIGAGLIGRVSIGLPPSLARLLTVPLSRNIRQQYPAARISIIEGMPAQLQKHLSSGWIDVALIYDYGNPQQEELTSILVQDLMLVLPAETELSLGQAIGLREVADLNLVLPTQPDPSRRKLDQELASLGLSANVVIEVDSISAIFDLVIAGYGGTVLPGSVVSIFASKQRLVARKITNPDLHSELYLATSAQRPLTRVQQNVTELLRQIAEDFIIPINHQVK